MVLVLLPRYLALCNVDFGLERGYTLKMSDSCPESQRSFVAVSRRRSEQACSPGLSRGPVILFARFPGLLSPLCSSWMRSAARTAACCGELPVVHTDHGPGLEAEAPRWPAAVTAP